MSGETEAEVSAWTVDSVRAHFETLLNERDVRYQERFVAQEAAVVLALATVKDLYDTMLAERDRRYEQRAANLESTMATALATVNKEFADRIDQVRSETVLAMAAAEKAISKAENATERRFESVNEFRAQQADIIQTFARKTEVDARLAGLTEKVEAFQAQVVQIGSAALPRQEYDRAHTDLAERVIQVEKAITEKLEAQTKGLEGRIALLQAQLSNIEAITR